MTDIQKQILEDIKKEITIDEMSKHLSLSHKQVYRRICNLKIYGYNIYRKYYSTGDVKFGLSNTVSTKNISKVLYTLPDSRELRALFISDTHLGNSKQRIDILNKLYDYCIQNNIHSIFNCGDFLNGLCYSSDGHALDARYDEQLDIAMKDYPFDSHILNYVLLGNHDKDYLNVGCINIDEAIEKKRYDIIPLSYEEAYIKIKNDQIYLYHPLDLKSRNNYSNKIVFRGHSHMSKFKHSYQEGSSCIYVPSLSDMFYDPKYSFPSFYDVIFYFDKYGSIDTLYITHNIYIDRVVKVGEYSNSFSFDKEIISSSNKINYEEDPKKKIKKVKK